MPSHFASSDEIIQYCKSHKILVNGYAPLGTPDHMAFYPSKMPVLLPKQPMVVSIARDLGKTPGQVLACWSLMQGIAINPRSQSSEVSSLGRPCESWIVAGLCIEPCQGHCHIWWQTLSYISFSHPPTHLPTLSICVIIWLRLASAFLPSICRAFRTSTTLPAMCARILA